jgi:hypothetical protein
MNISPAWEGALRGLGAVILVSVLAWLSNAANLNGLMAPSAVTIITMIAAAVESSMKASGSGALFGAVKSR